MTVLLRPWSRQDAPALAAAVQGDPDLRMQLGEVQYLDVPAAESFIQRMLRHDEGSKNWAIVEDGTAVGNVGASAIEFRHGTAWMHYWLSSPARGKGYATAALVTASDRSFQDGLHRLELGHRVNNPASCRVASAAGFLAEGIEREKLRYGVDRYDVETHARLRHDAVPSGAAALPIET